MDPTVRLLRLVATLQQRSEWSSEELADQLGVTTRTVRRDITRLRDLGYAVEVTQDAAGGSSCGPAGHFRTRADR